MAKFNIKILPRTTEKGAGAMGRGRIALGLSRAAIGQALLATGLFVLVGGLVGHFSPNESSVPVSRRIARNTPPPVDRFAASVNRHLNDSRMMAEVRNRKMNNDLQAAGAKDGALGATSLTKDDRAYGVQLDSDHTAEWLYEQLNQRKGEYGDSLEEKINSRLANRRWLNEMERAERVNFVRNFIRSAYDAGYEVQLDDNLVVVGVRRINQQKNVSIDQVLDRIARKGY